MIPGNFLSSYFYSESFHFPRCHSVSCCCFVLSLDRPSAVVGADPSLCRPENAFFSLASDTRSADSVGACRTFRGVTDMDVVERLGSQGGDVSDVSPPCPRCLAPHSAGVDVQRMFCEWVSVCSLAPRLCLWVRRLGLLPTYMTPWTRHWSARPLFSAS